MNPPYTIAQQIVIAKISSFLSADANDRSSIMQWGPYRGDERIPILLTMLYKRVEWANSLFPTSVSVQAVSEYMLSLCGRYINQAVAISNNSSGEIIIAPGSGQPVNLSFMTLFWEVGVTPGPPSVGDTNITINDGPAIYGSLSVYSDGIKLMPNLSDQYSYTFNITPTQISIDFTNNASGFYLQQKINIEYVKTVIL